MKLTLDLKKKCNFFWLRGIRSVRIDKCCAQCFIGDKFNEVYEKTHFKEKAHVELDIQPDPQVKAYYLCGLSAGFNWHQNTHVAFVPAPGETVVVDNHNIRLTITDARRIEFESYKPNPPGFFSRRQRTCRNWIFANFINDGMLRRKK